MNKYACEMNERAEINLYTIYVNKRVIIHVYIYTQNATRNVMWENVLLQM